MIFNKFYLRNKLLLLRCFLFSCRNTHYNFSKYLLKNPKSIIVLLFFKCYHFYFTSSSFQLYHQKLSFPYLCDHPIYCQGELLDTIQMSSIFNDSKTFVDMPSKFHPDLILEKFKNLSNFSISSLKEFISDNFLPAGSEIIAKVPEV